MNNSPIKASISPTGPFSGIVKACYETCEEPICALTFVQVGTDFVIISISNHQRASEKDVKRAGDACDVALEVEAKKRDVRNLLIAHQGLNAEWVREYKNTPSVKRLSYNTSSVAFIN
jgi:hypothetical protein